MKTQINPNKSLIPEQWNVGDHVLDDQYIVLKRCEGGMGVVYHCLNLIEKRIVALKTALANGLISQEVIDAMTRNFSRLKGLSHKHIVHAYDLKIDKNSGRLYMEMEWIEGISLDKYFFKADGDARHDWREFSRIFREVADALDYVHGKGVVHRDVKNGNIMLEGVMGNVKLIDFGIAGHLPQLEVEDQFEEERGEGLTDNYAGTHEFQSPEQWKGETATAVSDEYSLAVTAYNCLSGFPPFRHRNVTELRNMVLYDDVPRVRNLSDEANEVLIKALSKKPEKRFGKCVEFVEQLVNGLMSSTSHASPKTSNIGDDSSLDASDTNTTSPKTSNIGDDSSGEVSTNLLGGSGTVSLPGGVELNLVKIPAGSFTMGSPEGELGRFDWEKPHHVTISKDFWLGQYELTQGQWKAVGTERGEDNCFHGDRLPVENVSWFEAKAFCDDLNRRCQGQLPEGYRFDLPTEAQWEYACRAGTTTALNNGKDLTDENYNCKNLGDVAWYDYHHDGNTTHPVGQKRKNSWGLYDMHGNVWEWCLDCFGSYPDGAVTDPQGPSDGSYRVSRGGAWINRAGYCRSAYRGSGMPSNRSYDLGFRVALVPIV